MRPDARRDPYEGLPVPFDIAFDPDGPELEALATELAIAGEGARAERTAAGLDRPGPVFAADLRARLLAAYPAPASGAAASPAGVPAPGAGVALPADGTPRRLSGSISARRPLGFFPSRRWSVLAATAAIVVAVLGTTSGRFFPVPATASASEAAGTSLIRDGSVSTLVPGTTLRRGDEIRVGLDGHAILALGSGLTRLAGGADLRLDVLDADRIRVELLAGRSYHRVVPPAGGTYVVSTGPLTWTALGTAFDLDREPAGPLTERVTLLGLQHTVAIAGPDLRTTVGEGRWATVILGDPIGSDLAVGALPAAIFDDPWIVANARLDRALGYPLGVMDRIALGPEPTLAPTPTGSGQPTLSPAPSTEALATSTPTARPTPKPTPKPTPRPTPKPTPKPTPTPTPLPALGLTLTSCNGGIVIDWTQFEGSGFNHYTTLRNTSSSIPKAYPPEGGAVDPGGTYTTDKTKTSAVDAGLDAGQTFYYRTMAFNGSDKVIAASAVKSVATKAIADLGALVVGPDAGGTKFSWTSYGGSPACFTWYKLVYSAEDPEPSYLAGSPYLLASSDQAVDTYVAAIDSGTYWFRVQAIRATDLGKFVVAQTAVVQYAVP